MQHREAAAERFECRLQLDDGVPDELDATIGAVGERIEDLGIEHEHAPDRACLLQGVIQRGVIVGAQIAPEPHQRAVVAGTHPQPIFERRKRIRPPINGSFAYNSSAVSQ